VIQRKLGLKNNNHPQILLFICENVLDKKNPVLSIVLTFVKKHGFKLILCDSAKQAIEELKRTNISMILLEAISETKTETLVRILKTMLKKRNISICLIAEQFSRHIKELITNISYGVTIELKNLTPKEIQSKLDNILNDSQDFSIIPHTRGYEIINSLKETNTLPPMPDIYYKVEKLSRNPKTNLTDYAKIIELDSDIVARILRLCNSAFFSFNRKISSMKDAVVLMGTHDILQLVRIACITGNLKFNPDSKYAARKIWEHSVSCAFAAKLLYDKKTFFDKQDIESELFIGGIIHDIGKIILLLFSPDAYKSIMLKSKANALPSIADEEKIFATNHCIVGKALANFWKLPKSIGDIIALHHKPILEPNSDIVMMIHLSNILGHLAFQTVPTDNGLGLDPGVLGKIGLTEKKFIDTTSDLIPSIKELTAFTINMIIE